MFFKYTREKFAEDFSNVIDNLEDLFKNVPKSNLGRGEWISQYRSAMTSGERAIARAHRHGIEDPLADQMLESYAKRFVESFY